MSLVLSIFVFTSAKVVYAKDSIKVIPGGESIGIKLNTGVYVAGKYQVDTIDGKVEPWRKSDIEVGDKIVMIDNVNVDNNIDLINNVNKIIGIKYNIFFVFLDIISIL